MTSSLAKRGQITVVDGVSGTKTEKRRRRVCVEEGVENIMLYPVQCYIMAESSDCCLLCVSLTEISLYEERGADSV